MIRPIVMSAALTLIGMAPLAHAEDALAPRCRADARTEARADTGGDTSGNTGGDTNSGGPSARVAQASAPTPSLALAAANHAARHGPQEALFQEARQVFAYAPGAIYLLQADPGFVSAILLEPGEHLNDIAAGDTARWMVQHASADAARAVVLVKPQSAGLSTNLVLVTDRRIYLIEARAEEGADYTAELAWCYPESARQAQPAASIAELNLAYRVRLVRGRAPAWMPRRVFDDGQRTWIEMPEAIGSGELPPLFVITGEGVEVVNYRIEGRRYRVDRLFDRAELRLGTRAPTIVRIEREGAERESTARARDRKSVV